MDVLHELIKSMRPAEKALFKKNAHRLGGGGYVKLFDAMAAMDVYDEDKIRKKFNKDSFIKHLARTKNYLYESITRTLIDIDEQSGPETIVKKYIREAEVLRNRGLLSQSARMIAKARSIAEERELFAPLLDCLQLQIKLSGTHLYREEELKVTSLNKAVGTIVEKMANLNSYNLISSHLEEITSSSFVLRQAEVRAQIEASKGNAILQDESQAICVRSRLRFNYCHFFIATLLRDYESERKYSKNYLDLALSTRGFNDEYSLEAISGYNMVLSAYQSSGDSETKEKYLAAFKNHQTGNVWLEAIKFQYFCIFALKHYSDTLNHRQFVDSASYSLQKLKALKDLVREEYRLSIYIVSSEGYIRFGMYSDALDVIEEYRSNPPRHDRFDYQNYLLIFYLIAHFEIGNFQLVGNLAKNVKRFMKRTGEFGEIENKILKIFDILLNNPERKARIAKLKALSAEMHSIAKATGGVVWKNNLGIITPFIESKIVGVKYHAFISDAAKD